MTTRSGSYGSFTLPETHMCSDKQAMTSHSLLRGIMTSETRFQISVQVEALALLHRKPADARFPDELSDASWDYGVPLSDVKRLVNKWKDSYDWRTHEREFNKPPDVYT